MKSRWLLLAALSGFFCVAFGAFAAHSLEKSLSEQALIWIDKGLKYQMFHTLTLLGLSLFQLANFAQHPPACRAKMINVIAGSWSLGILCFSGSLYTLALGGSKIFVWTTPVGGVAFLVGWLALAVLALVAKNPSQVAN